jgi:O-antigen ligase
MVALGLVMATATFVLTEPAPFDMAMVLLLLWAVLGRKLAFHSAHVTPVILVACLALTHVISLWSPIDVWRGVWFLAVTLYLMVSMFLICGVTSRFGIEAIRILATGYAIAGVLAVLLGAFGYYVHSPWQSALLLYGRPKGLFKDPNVFGPYLVPMVVYAMSQLVAQGRHRLVNTAVLVIAAFGVLISFSRAAWLNCILAAVAYLPLRLLSLRSTSERTTLLRRAAMAGLLLVAAAVVIMALPGIRDMIALRMGDNGLNNYDSERFAAHEEALNTALTHPLGIGPGQWELWYYLSTHSLYYRVLSENGFLSLAILAVFMAASLYRALRLTMQSPSDSWRNLYAVLSACLLGLLLNSAVVDTLHWRHTWLLLGLIWTSRPAPGQSALPLIAAIRSKLPLGRLAVNHR